MDKTKIGRYLILLLKVIVGIAILLLVDSLKLTKLGTASLLLTLFVLLNLGITFFLKIQQQLYTYWSLKKIYLLLIGTLGGVVIAFLPPLLAVILGELEFDELFKKPNFNLTTILLTFLVVSWEEFWFRSLLLNFAKQKLSTINISVFVGVLFMVLHLLNPDFNIIESGLALFFAGSLLTILYLYYKNIWLPIGVHFGNNYLQSILTTHLDKHQLFANDGYISAAILALVFVYYVAKDRKLERVD